MGTSPCQPGGIGVLYEKKKAIINLLLPCLAGEAHPEKKSCCLLSPVRYRANVTFRAVCEGTVVLYSLLPLLSIELHLAL
jgi:hypothetical protein